MQLSGILVFSVYVQVDQHRLFGDIVLLVRSDNSLLVS